MGGLIGMVYIDFDGVILDTEELLFKEWRKNPNHSLLPEKSKIRYIQEVDWEFILNHSDMIHDSIYYLKNMDPKDSAILTKIHSLTNEGVAKVNWIRSHDILQNVILVPYPLKKCDMVDANGNILVDDSLKNLDDWSKCNGTPIFFDMDDDNYDSWDRFNVKGYEKVLSLSRFVSKK